MSSSLFGILSPRNVTLFVFILVVLFLGATFDVQVGPEGFKEGSEYNSQVAAAAAKVAAAPAAATTAAAKQK
jgi:hypothetical protein